MLKGSYKFIIGLSQHDLRWPHRAIVMLHYHHMGITVKTIRQLKALKLFGGCQEKRTDVFCWLPMRRFTRISHAFNERHILMTFYSKANKLAGDKHWPREFFSERAQRPSFLSQVDLHIIFKCLSTPAVFPHRLHSAVSKRLWNGIHPRDYDYLHNPYMWSH